MQLQDARTLVIRDMVYDGEGPDAYFYAGVRGPRNAISEKTGVKVPYPTGDPTAILPEFKAASNGAEVTLDLPVDVVGVRWLSVWCNDFGVDFGSLKFPKKATLAAMLAKA